MLLITNWLYLFLTSCLSYTVLTSISRWFHSFLFFNLWKVSTITFSCIIRITENSVQHIEFYSEAFLYEHYDYNHHIRPCVYSEAIFYEHFDYHQHVSIFYEHFDYHHHISIARWSFMTTLSIMKMIIYTVAFFGNVLFITNMSLTFPVFFLMRNGRKSVIIGSTHQLWYESIVAATNPNLCKDSLVER